uniref:Single domain-containing protein n=1 Tax=Amblyomma maculatum TaxID=34609 RepID=G3MQB8_AMBMU
MLVRALLCGLILPMANSFDSSDLNILTVSVTMEGGKCVYKNHTFPSYYDPSGDNCELWTCNKPKHTVSVMGCSPLPPGCERKPKANSTFPKCCEKSCLNKTTPPCQTPDGTPLLEGGEYNSTKPCLRYECLNGTLIMEECPHPEPTDPRCSRSLAEEAPYPACCGAGIVCQHKGKAKGKGKGRGKDGKNKRKKRSSKKNL